MMMTDRKLKDPGRGFTLLEVLISLAIVAIAVVLVLESLLASTTRATMMRDQTLASWIGFNKLTEYRIAENLPDAGDDDGEIDYAGMTWHWYSVISETPVENLRRVEVSVAFADDPEQYIATTTGFLGLPTPRSEYPTWVLSKQGGNGSNDNRDNR